MKHIIDVDTWVRRDNYRFFQTFVSSWYAVTTEIDCTEAREAARRRGRSFFLHYLYAVVRAANEVDELRYRIDKQASPCASLIMKTLIPSTPKPIGS